MGNPVNKRVLMLKTQLGLTDIEFCGRASISTGTLQKLKGSEQVTPRVLNSIITAFNVNRDWLMTGKGDLFAIDTQQVDVDYKNEAWAMAKQQLEKKDKEIEVKDSILQNLAISFDRVTKMMQDSGMSFLHPVAKTGT